MEKISYVERRAAKGSRTFFRTQSPRHFEGGDWNQGGSCRRREPLLSHEVSSFVLIITGTESLINVSLRDYLA